MPAKFSSSRDKIEGKGFPGIAVFDCRTLKEAQSRANNGEIYDQGFFPRENPKRQLKLSIDVDRKICKLNGNRQATSLDVPIIVEEERFSSGDQTPE